MLLCTYLEKSRRFADGSNVRDVRWVISIYERKKHRWSTPDRRDPRLTFRHGKVEMSIRHASRDTEWINGYASLESKKRSRLELEMWVF